MITDKQTQIGEIANILGVDTKNLVSEIEDCGACCAIRKHIKYTTTIEAYMGIHKETGMVMRKLRTITIDPLDHGFDILNENDCLDPEQVREWLAWCNKIGVSTATIAQSKYSEKANKYLETVLNDGVVEWEDLPAIYYKASQIATGEAQKETT